jgi:hypothetical protein
MNTAKNLTLALLASLTLVTVLGGTPAARAEAPAPKAAANTETAAKAAASTDAKEVTLKGTLGCAKCSFHEAKACQNVLKVKDGEKVETYVLADNAVSRDNHERVCGPSSPATVTGTVTKSKSKKDHRKVLTASAIQFDPS